MLKSYKNLLLVTVIILPALFLFSVASDLPHVFVITMAGLLGSMMFRQTFKLNDRSIIYTGVMIFVLIVLLDYMFKLDRNRFGLISSLLRPNLLIPLGFYCAVAITFFRSGKETVGVAAAAALGGIMLSGDVSEFDPQTTRLFMFSALHVNMKLFFFIVMVIELIIILFAVSYASRINQNISKGKAVKRILLWGTIITVPLLAWSLTRLYDTHGDVIRQLESQILRVGMRKFHYNQHKVFHGADIDLNRTVSADMMKNQQLIILRAGTPVAPGYMRGFVYTEYKDGRWYRDEKIDRKMMQSKQNDGMLASKLFSTDKIEKLAVGYEVYPTSDFSSEVLLTPGNTQQLDLIADRISFTDNGEFKPTDWEQDGGYSVQVNKIIFESAYGAPATPDPATYLAIPDKLSAPLKQQLQRIELECGLNNESSDNERFTKIVQWFRDNFKYKLRDQGNADSDPVLWFLDKTREGHCELFASSMALLLRAAGIKTRYVTGFICADRHPSGRYYVARLGNAHAWLEAWARDKQRWVLVEPTPPSGVPTRSSEWSTAAAWGDRFKQIVQTILLGLRRGYVAEMIVRVVTEIFKLLLDLLWNPVVTPLLLLFIIYRLHRWRRNRHAHHDKGRQVSAEIILLSHEFSILEQKIRKSYSDISGQSTLVEFITDLETLGAPESLIVLLKRYQTVRFDPNKQTPTEIEPLIKAIRAAKRQLKDQLKNRSDLTVN